MKPDEIRYESLGMARQDANLMAAVHDVEWILTRAKDYEKYMRGNLSMTFTVNVTTIEPEPYNWSA